MSRSLSTHSGRASWQLITTSASMPITLDGRCVACLPRARCRPEAGVNAVWRRSKRGRPTQGRGVAGISLAPAPAVENPTPLESLCTHDIVPAGRMNRSDWRTALTELSPSRLIAMSNRAQSANPPSSSRSIAKSRQSPTWLREVDWIEASSFARSWHCCLSSLCQCGYAVPAIENSTKMRPIPEPAVVATPYRARAEADVDIAGGSPPLSGREKPWRLSTIAGGSLAWTVSRATTIYWRPSRGGTMKRHATVDDGEESDAVDPVRAEADTTVNLREPLVRIPKNCPRVAVSRRAAAAHSRPLVRSTTPSFCGIKLSSFIMDFPGRICTIGRWSRSQAAELSGVAQRGGYVGEPGQCGDGGVASSTRGAFIVGMSGNTGGMRCRFRWLRAAGLGWESSV